jgi:hypothetical protein
MYNEYNDPFLDMASTTVPSDIKEIFKWVEYVYIDNGIVRSATERLVNYFITDVNVVSDSSETVDIVNDVLKAINIKSLLTTVGIDYVVYGNSFSTVYFPFIRMLKCTRCGFEINAKNDLNPDLYKIRVSNKKFVGNCICGAKGVTFEVKDVVSQKKDDFNILRIDPKKIKQKHNIYSGKSDFYWMLSGEFSSYIGDYENDHILRDTPMEILNTIMENKDFRFHSDCIFYIKQPTLSGLDSKWGYPIFLNILKTNYYGRVLRKANEMIANEFIFPYRVLSPGSSTVDPISTLSLSNFVSEMHGMIDRHRDDPLDFLISPVPVQYQAFGGEKKALDVTMEIEAINKDCLHSLNYPAEIYFNTLQINAMPVALRIMEGIWSNLVNGLNGFLQWTVNHICSHFDLASASVNLTKVSFADDMEKKNILMQLASANQVSWISALKQYGIDFETEQETLMRQNKILMGLQKKMEAEAAKESEMGIQKEEQPEQSMDNIEEQAAALADHWATLPDSERKVHMNQMKVENMVLYALASKMWEQKRNSARTLGGNEYLAQHGFTGPTEPPA